MNNFVENPDHPIALTTSNFHEAVQHYPFLVVDCWAEWCGPCRMISPILDQMAKDNKGKMVIGKINADTDPQVLMEYGIMSIPTLLIFKNGEKVDQIVGAMPRQMLESRLEPLMN